MTRARTERRRTDRRAVRLAEPRSPEIAGLCADVDYGPSSRWARPTLWASPFTAERLGVDQLWRCGMSEKPRRFWARPAGSLRSLAVRRRMALPPTVGTRRAAKAA